MSAPKNNGKSWDSEAIKELKDLAKSNTPTRIIALKLGRTPAAVQAEAAKERISLKPTNQSPYGTKGKSKGK